VVRSALAGKPVIARDQGVVGRQVGELQFGVALDSDEAQTVAEALTRFCDDDAARQRMARNGPRAFAGNTPENFARPIVEAINRTVKPR
jgi:glycosyltransferase involved in cell wall biosynthesis